MSQDNKPLVPVTPGDPITAGRWNAMQCALRQEHIQHTHNGTWKDGLFDGARITSDGLADGAVTGTKIDPRADLQIRTLRIGGDNLASDTSVLRVAGSATIEGPLKVSAAAELASLAVAGNTTLASLKVTAAELTNLAATSLKVSGPAELASLAIAGTTTLAALKVGGLAELTSLTATNLKVNGMTELAGLTATNLKVTTAELSNLAVAGATTLAGLKVNAAVNAASLALTSGLKVAGDADLGALQVQGAAQFKGTLIVKDRHAVVAEGALPRIVWGHVNSAGELVGGSGLRLERNTDRTYTWVYFDRPFVGTPAVLGQQLGSGNILDNLLIDDVSAQRFSVMTGNSSGTREWRPFCFIVIGPG